MAIAAVLCLALADNVAGGNASDALTSYTLTSLDGKKVKLSSYHGDVVVVNFWASWCAPCRKELPIMDEWQKKWADRGARVVAISVDNEARNARRFAEQAKLSLTVFHDGPAGLAKTLDLPSLPCTYLLDRNGNVVTVIRSSSDDELAALQQQVETLLASTRDHDVQKASAGGTP